VSRALPFADRRGIEGDFERLRIDMQSPEVARVVDQDMADANEVGVALCSTAPRPTLEMDE
jgi:hypothetical protein